MERAHQQPKQNPSRRLPDKIERFSPGQGSYGKVSEWARIKAYDRLFTEISPPIPQQEYADYFKVNGMLMPDYTIEGEEPRSSNRRQLSPENTGQEKEREHMSEQFSIMIGNRSRFDAGDPGGYWLDMPATKDKQKPDEECGTSALPPTTRRIFPFAAIPTTRRNILPCLMKWHAPPTWTNLNFLAARLEQLDLAEVGKLNAALQQKNGLANIGQVIDFTYNVDFYVHIPEVHNYHDLGDYYLNQSGMRTNARRMKGGIDLSTLVRMLLAQEKARLSSTAISWKAVTSGNGSLRGAKCRKNTAL